MKHIYIFNHTCKGARFGVGAYIQQLLQLKHCGFAMHVVHLNAGSVDVSVQMEDGVEVIYFPNPVLAPLEKIKSGDYCINVIRILRQYIDRNADNIFHLNYIEYSDLAKYIQQYLKGKTVFTIHYSQSLFSLCGNIAKLREIIASPETENETPNIAVIRNEVRNVRQITNRYVDRVVSISQHSLLQNNDIYQIENTKNTLIYNALCDYLRVDVSAKTENKKSLGISCSEKIIVFAGRLDEIKGVQCLLQALTVVKNKGIKFHLFISGRGNFEAAMDYIHDLYTHITFTGFLGKERLFQLFSAADIGVFPSLYEEFGYVILEMMMHRLPVVAYRTSGPAEIIEDGHTGLLADMSIEDPEYSIKNLAEKIEFLLVNPKECRRMGAAGRKRFLKYFSTKTFNKKMIDLYSSL